jgi:CubicO group peptidase (beta-lactamase class C family)
MKRWALIAAAAVVAGGVFAIVKTDAMVGIGAGYMAKVTCSEIYVAGRNPAAVLANDFHDISPVLDRVRVSIDSSRKTVSGSAFGLGGAKAIFRDGYGCTLVRGGTPEALPALAPVADKALADARKGTAAAQSGVDYAAIEAALDRAFADEKAATRAILVVRNGAIIAERYADGFAADTPFLSWSMGKSVTASMVGAAVLQGMIDIEETPAVPEWLRKGDPRAGITWNNLLQMQSGLAFDETYSDPNSDVSKMLFRARSAGKVAADKPPLHKPGTYWSYSSGTTNLIQRSLRDTLEGNDAGYQSFARDKLFAPIGAASFVLEPDSSGTFIGSSFVYATARDWAKLGMLYLNDGVVDGVRILPEGWSRYVAAPASASDGFYGAQFWLNHPGATDRPKYMPDVPDDAYLMAGHEGQYVLIIPDKNMIIVRTGMTRGAEPMPLVAPTFAAIYAAVGQ